MVFLEKLETASKKVKLATKLILPIVGILILIAGLILYVIITGNTDFIQNENYLFLLCLGILLMIIITTAIAKLVKKISVKVFYILLDVKKMLNE